MLSSENFIQSAKRYAWNKQLDLYVPQPMGREHIDFGVDPDGVGVGVTLSCQHNILETSGWILTKFSWIYNWDITWFNSVTLT